MKQLNPKPPQNAIKFLRWFCKEDYIEEIEGDLTEVFEKRLEQSPSKARRQFSWSVIRYFRPEFIKTFSILKNSTAANMYKHNLKLTFRNFRKHKSSFLINIVGLSTGLACALVIYLWVTDELNFDKFHEKDKHLFQVMHNIDNPQEVNTIEWTPGPLYKTLADDFPEVEYVVPTFPPSGYTFNGVINNEDIRIKAQSKYAGKDFFNLFSFRLIEGDKNKLLTDKQGVVISEEMAISLFNTTRQVIGKTIRWEHGEFSGDYHVTGVFEKIPAHSTLQFDLLFSYDRYEYNREELTRWSYNDPSLYISLQASTNEEVFSSKIGDIVKKHDPESKSTLFLRKYSDQYLYGNYENGKEAGGRIDYVVLFIYIAAFVLIIACINFVNLSTARASRRMKEIGVKKCIGAKRSALVGQYLGESLIISLFSTLVALVLVYLFLPTFNNVTGKTLMLELEFKLMGTVLIISLITGLLAGSYPAIYLSGFNPVSIFRGSRGTTGMTAWIRKGLVTFQFTVSIVLIVMVIIVNQQIGFIQSKNLGYDKDNVVNIFSGQIEESQFTTTLNEIEKIPGVLGVTAMRGDMTSGLHNTTIGLHWEGQEDGELVKFTDLVVDHNFFETLGIEIKEGRSFSREFSTETDKIIFNESAVEAMRLTDPIGQIIEMWGQKKQIIGVVSDFHVESLYKKVEPALFRLDNGYMTILAKIKAGNEQATVNEIQSFYKSLSNGLTLEYEFMDETYQQLYISEQRVSTLSSYSAVITIIISCLGLFGLVAFTAERRVKEISIRKILGSSAKGIVLLLSKDFTKIVLLAIAISLPLSYLMASHWLENFAYHINIKWWTFVIVGIMALSITWVTISLQTFKVANINPVDKLKEE